MSLGGAPAAPAPLRIAAAGLAVAGAGSALWSVLLAGFAPGLDRDGGLAVLAVALGALALAAEQRALVVAAVVTLLAATALLAGPLAFDAIPGQLALRAPFAALCLLAAVALLARLARRPASHDLAAILAGTAFAATTARLLSALVGDPGSGALWPLPRLFLAPLALIPLLAWPAWARRHAAAGGAAATAQMLSLLMLGIALVVLLGHVLDSALLTTGVGPNKLPLQATAACAVAGMFLHAASHRRRSRYAWGLVLGLFALLALAAVAVPEWAQVLRGRWLPQEGLRPGRGLYNGLAALILCAGGLLAASRRPGTWVLRGVQILGLLAGAASMVAISGIIAHGIYGVDPILGADQLSFFGLLVILFGALGMFALATSRTGVRLRRTEGLPALVTATALAVTVSLWGGASRQADDAIAATSDVALEAMKRTLGAELESRNRDMSRLAAQLAADTPEARSARMVAAGRALAVRYVSLARLSWVPDQGDALVYEVAQGRLVGDASMPPQDHLGALERRLRETASRAGRTVFGAAPADATAPRTLGHAERAVRPDRTGDGVLLALFAVGDDRLPLLIGSPVPGYGAAVVLDGVSFGIVGAARAPAPDDDLARFLRQDAAPLWGMSARIAVWPLPQSIERLHSRLPTAILAAGCLIAALLAVVTVLAGAARERARSAQQAQRVAEASQREVVALLEGLPDAFFAYDREWRFTHLNAAAERLVRTPREAVLGRVLWDISPAATVDFAEPYRRSMSQRTIERFEFFYDRLGVWLSVQSFPLPDGIGVVARDVSRERMTLDALSRREADLAQALEIADLARLELDAGERVVWSGAATRVLGCTAEDLPADRAAVRRMWHPDDAAMLLPVVEQGIREGRGYDVEHRIVWRDGTVRWVHTVARVIVEDDATRRVVATVQDITERRLQARAVLERDRFFEGSRDLFCIISRSGRFLQVNPALCRAFGVPREGLIGRVVFDFTVDEERDASRQRFAGVLDGAPGKSSVFRIRNADGHVRSVHWTSTLSPDGDVYAVGHDVTDRLAAEIERERTLAELEARNEELQQFAYIASHDLQEPLRKIQAFGDRLGGRYGEVLGAEGRDYLLRMDNAARRMSTLISDLLEYSRVATRGSPFSAVPLDDVLDDVLGDLEESVRAAGAVIERGPLPVIEADRTQMAQMLQNLVGNALKYRDPRRAVRVEVRGAVVAPAAGAVVEWLRISIADNGIGFDASHRERIFAPFQRLHGRSEYAGTGIGLAIVRKIVERHGGRVTADGRPGQGATFTVELPLRQA